MKVVIIWSPRSESDFFNICNFLLKNWNEKVILNFIDSTEKNIKYIAAFPFMFPAFDKKGDVRKCVLNKFISLYYRVKMDRIELITFYDTRQDPRKFKL